MKGDQAIKAYILQSISRYDWLRVYKKNSHSIHKYEVTLDNQDM